MMGHPYGNLYVFRVMNMLHAIYPLINCYVLQANLSQ